jgi:RNA polymerase sigma-70 factor (ECF subfamily)
MDERQFLQLLSGHEGIIFKICRLYRDTPEDREDLFQEIVYQLWKSLPGYEARSKFSTWLYKIALSTALVHFRRRRPAIVYMPALPDVPDQAEENRLLELLAPLDAADKALMTLYLEDLSYAEIAEITGITENNVGVRLNRVRARIKKHVKANSWKN